MQMLFQLESSQETFESVKKTFWHHHEAQDGETLSFVDALVAGVIANKETIDAMIAKHSTHWKISRMPLVDKNILRLAVYEILLAPDIPMKVTLNEAIEIAKKFGTEESSAFVNGVLDNIAKEHQKG